MERRPGWRSSEFGGLLICVVLVILNAILSAYLQAQIDKEYMLILLAMFGVWAGVRQVRKAVAKPEPEAPESPEDPKPTA